MRLHHHPRRRRRGRYGNFRITSPPEVPPHALRPFRASRRRRVAPHSRRARDRPPHDKFEEESPLLSFTLARSARRIQVAIWSRRGMGTTSELQLPFFPLVPGMA